MPMFIDDDHVVAHNQLLVDDTVLDLKNTFSRLSWVTPLTAMITTSDALIATSRS